MTCMTEEFFSLYPPKDSECCCDCNLAWCQIQKLRLFHSAMKELKVPNSIYENNDLDEMITKKQTNMPLDLNLILRVCACMFPQCI